LIKNIANINTIDLSDILCNVIIIRLYAARLN